MNTGILAAACMYLVLSQGPTVDSANQGQPLVDYTNQRQPRIPVNIAESYRNQISEILLYVSTNQGRSWEPAVRIPSSKDAFILYAKDDGPHWLRVAFINKQGQQSPDEKSILTEPPDNIVIVDTRPPVIRTIQAVRRGDEVEVTWDIQEDNPDRNGLRVEYLLKGTTKWLPVPAPFGLNGLARFRPAGNQAAMVRVTAVDLAKNESYAQKEVEGTIAAASFTNPGNSGAAGSNAMQAPPGIPPPLPIPGPPALGTLPTLPRDLQFPTPPVQQAKGSESYTAQSSPGARDSFGTNQVIPPPPMQPSIPVPMQPPQRESRPEKIIADSQLPIVPPVPIPPPMSKPAPEPILPKPVASVAPARKPLPEVIHVNHHRVTLEYQLKRVGPSGVGEIELWLTRDDGATWERFARAQDVQGEDLTGLQKRTFDFLYKDKDGSDRPFPDGVYGMSLVVKNRAGLGREPRPGDVPEIRIEIDTELPKGKLYPLSADPMHPNHVLLKWTAKDKNLAQAPIHLEYAEKPDGPWLPIKLDLENTGRHAGTQVTVKDGDAVITDEITGDYSWKVPDHFPVQVYLRLRVRDKAGNECVAATREPQFVDLTEPEGRLVQVLPVPKN